MKKMVLLVAGLVVLIGVVILIGRQGTHRTQEEGLEQGGTTKGKTSVNSSAAGDEKDIGTTKDTNYTKVESEKSADGQTGKSAPQVSDVVKALIGQDGKKHNYSSLLKAINDLSKGSSKGSARTLRHIDFQTPTNPPPRGAEQREGVTHYRFRSNTK